MDLRLLTTSQVRSPFQPFLRSQLVGATTRAQDSRAVRMKNIAIVATSHIPRVCKDGKHHCSLFRRPKDDVLLDYKNEKEAVDLLGIVLS